MTKTFYAFVVSAMLAVQVRAQSYPPRFERYVQHIEGTSMQFSMEAILGGVFMMGDARQLSKDASPAVEVELSPFWMSTYEVTWDLYQSFLYKDYEQSKQQEGKIPIEVDAVTRPTKPYLDMTFGFGKEGYPALAMTHYNAIQFCKWLYTRTGIFYRLPTEAEWEYACRAGSAEIYPFGNSVDGLDKYSWYVSNSHQKTHPVGQKQPNAYGLYDMLGNVAEWTYDQYQKDYFQSLVGKKVKDPFNEPTELYPHVVRGGSFKSKPEDLMSFSRSYSDPSWKQLDPQVPKSNWWFPEAPFVGLRLVRPFQTPSKEDIDAYYNTPPIEDF